MLIAEVPLRVKHVGVVDHRVPILPAKHAKGDVEVRFDWMYASTTNDDTCKADVSGTGENVDKVYAETDARVGVESSGNGEVWELVGKGAVFVVCGKENNGHIRGVLCSGAREEGKELEEQDSPGKRVEGEKRCHCQ